MRRIILELLLVVFFLSLACAAETFVNAPVIDVMCSHKEKTNPDGHTRACSLQCQESGFGILTTDGKFLKFDKSGNGKMMELLKKTDKTDHLRVNVTGTVEGDMIKVGSVSLN